jgi:hypothetical protein
MNEIELQEVEARLRDFQLFLDTRKHELDLRELDIKRKMDSILVREKVLNDMISQIQKESKE